MFREHVAHVTWLSPESRSIALAKLDSLYVGIGYPEEWQNWSDLHIDPNDAFGNSQRIADRTLRRALARLSKPFDPHEWVLTPQTVGAVLVFQQNAYEFAAALLQPPKYDAEASDAAAYGAIGAIIGHDMSHFVDVLGADYEADGRMRRWWTAEDAAKFETAAEPIVRQFSEYQPLPGSNVDGRLTRTENVADLAGLTAAFQAHRKSLGAKAADRDYVRRRDREFFIAFAQAFATTMNETALRAQLAERPCAWRCTGWTPCGTSTRGTRPSTLFPGSGSASNRAPAFASGRRSYVVVRRTLVARGPFRAPVAQLELDAIALAQHVDALAVNGAGMKEHLFAGGISNKTESFVCSQCLDGSCHSLTRSYMDLREVSCRYSA